MRPAVVPRTPLRSIGGLVALGTFAAWLGLSGVFGSATASAGQAGTPAAGDLPAAGDVAAGRSLYLNTCAACHGSQAEGSQLAPGLREAGTGLIDFMVRTGRMPLAEPGQPARRGAPMLRPSEIQNLLAYMATVTTGPPVPDNPSTVTSAADLAVGRGLFTANCAVCHGATGAGDAVGGGIVAPPLDRSEAIDVLEAVAGGPDPMPRFSFAPDDMRAIAGYVDYLRDPPSPGGASIAVLGPVSEGLIAGGIGLVALLVIVWWVARSRELAQRIPAPADEEPYAGDGG